MATAQIPGTGLGPSLAGWTANGPGPLYRRLAESIRGAIRRAEMPSGTRLPTERALAAELSVSRSTVVAAYDLLREEGWLESRQGSGTWVRRHASVVAVRRGPCRVRRAGDDVVPSADRGSRRGDRVHLRGARRGRSVLEARHVARARGDRPRRARRDRLRGDRARAAPRGDRGPPHPAVAHADDDGRGHRHDRRATGGRSRRRALRAARRRRARRGPHVPDRDRHVHGLGCAPGVGADRRAGPASRTPARRDDRDLAAARVPDADVPQPDRHADARARAARGGRARAGAPGADRRGPHGRRPHARRRPAAADRRVPGRRAGPVDRLALEDPVGRPSHRLDPRAGAGRAAARADEARDRPRDLDGQPDPGAAAARGPGRDPRRAPSAAPRAQGDARGPAPRAPPRVDLGRARRRSVPLGPARGCAMRPRSRTSPLVTA